MENSSTPPQEDSFGVGGPRALALCYRDQGTIYLKYYSLTPAPPQCQEVFPEDNKDSPRDFNT